MDLRINRIGKKLFIINDNTKTLLTKDSLTNAVKDLKSPVMIKTTGLSRAQASKVATTLIDTFKIVYIRKETSILLFRQYTIFAKRG